MRTATAKSTFFFISTFFLILNSLKFLHVSAQPGNLGFACTPAEASYPCQTYVYFRAQAPDYLDLGAVGDLFSLSRRQIAAASSIPISNVSAPLRSDQPLFVPITCGCNPINATFGNLSFAGINYTFISGDTYWKISTQYFQNLTTYQSTETVNPGVEPTKIEVGESHVFPIFCKCPNSTRARTQTRFLITYIFHPEDNLTSLASRFNTTVQDIVTVNGNNITAFDTVFIPVSNLPAISQPVGPAAAPPPQPPQTPSPDSGDDDNNGAVIGLGIGLGVCLALLLLILALCVKRERKLKKALAEAVDVEKKRPPQPPYRYDKGDMKDASVSLLADVADYLDKYRVFEVEELREATDDFSDSLVIEGAVYKGTIGGEVYAIKKMNWNAYEELKILQKVNHGNLVKLEGFCIDAEEANCYLVYEYVENGSLNSWLHGDPKRKLSWKSRLRVAIDVANGLQYIHEHTRPQVVHKDIKSSNILLDSNMRAKIANFGLAKSGCNAITMHIVGTQGYIAPEYLTDGVVSAKMDVFSFGVVLLELVTGRDAIDGEGKVLWAKAGGILEGTEDQKLKKLKDWMDGYLLKETLSMESLLNVMSVAVACVNRDPSKRPNMVDIVYALCKSDDFLSDFSEEGASPRAPVTAR